MTTPTLKGKKKRRRCLSLPRSLSLFVPERSKRERGASSSRERTRVARSKERGVASTRGRARTERKGKRISEDESKKGKKRERERGGRGRKRGKFSSLSNRGKKKSFLFAKTRKWNACLFRELAFSPSLSFSLFRTTCTTRARARYRRSRSPLACMSSNSGMAGALEGEKK